MDKTKELLEKEIKNLTQARDGIDISLNLLKRDGFPEDNHLIELYNNFNSKIKDYTRSIGILNEEYTKFCVKG